MKPLVNFEETPGKVVGTIKQRSPAEAMEWMARQIGGMGIKLPYPKGVYRFKTFEEADEWQIRHQVAAAAKRLRASQHQPPSPTPKTARLREWLRRTFGARD